MTADESFDPERLEEANFEIVRRGFDPTEVRGHLQQAADEYRRLRLERDELAGRLAEIDGVPIEQLDVSRVTAALGMEAAKVLEAAHQAAVERADRAEREADAVREEALTEAEAARSTAQTEADQLLADARRAAEELVEDGRTRGRDMVAEAQTVRERMLGDLARKRQTGRAQVEQLKAARDRLLESLTNVQGNLDTAMADLIESVPDARAAAERAGLRVSSEPELTTDQLEAEIEAARLVGHPLVEEVADPGDANETFDTDEMMALTDLDEALQESADAADDGGADTATDDAGGPELYDVEADIDETADAEDEASGVDVLFAKLRESQSDDADEPTGEEDGEPAPDDPRIAARVDTIATAVKALKKVLVDEQGTLLDGIRRDGSEAVHALIDDAGAHATPYDDAARPALVALAGDLGADAVDLEPALAQLHAIALDPVRQRLAEVAEVTDDADELSDTVRALYRESRSRRIPEAAAAAVVAIDGLAVLATSDGSVRWVVDPDGPCGSDCADNALAGDVAPGESFPTGDLHPPSHPRCTCHLVPVD